MHMGQSICIYMSNILYETAVSHSIAVSYSILLIVQSAMPNYLNPE